MYITLYITYFILSLSIAVLAVVVSEIISAEGNILAFYGRFLDWMDEKGLEWIARPLGLCPKCFAGQMALWMFLFLPEYSFVVHIFFIAWSILFAELLTICYGKISM